MIVLDYFEGSGAGFGIIIVVLCCLPLGLPLCFFTPLLFHWRKEPSAHGPNTFQQELLSLGHS